VARSWRSQIPVIPAKAGNQHTSGHWVPAFAGMTKKEGDRKLLLQDGRVCIEDAVFQTDGGRFLN
jgi:hypothetical protein